MLRIFFQFVLPVGLAVWAMVDVLQTPEEKLQGMPKVLWVLLILIVPLIGPLVYLFAGKVRGGGRNPATRGGAGPAGRSLAPDDDPAFLEKLRLHKWEQDLKDRERKLREEGESGTT